jgi:hypothetical protein
MGRPERQYNDSLSMEGNGVNEQPHTWRPDTGTATEYFSAYCAPPTDTEQDTLWGIVTDMDRLVIARDRDNAFVAMSRRLRALAEWGESLTAPADRVNPGGYGTVLAHSILGIYPEPPEVTS